MPELRLTGDTHIGHRSIVLHARRERFIYPNPDYNPDIPKNFKTNWPEAVDLEAHDEWIIEEVWNSVVGKKDTTIIVGDFIWKNQLHILQRLNGKKILVIGNHDKVSKQYLARFDISDWNFDMYMDADEHIAEKYPNQFTEIHTEWHKTFEKKLRIIFSHCPYLTWPGSCHGAWNVHGHCHGRMVEYDDVLRTDIGIDAWGELVHFDILKKLMLDRYPLWKAKRNEINADRGESQGSLEENRIKHAKYLDTETHEKE